jgi:dihydroorotate dehydrogenase electron transfer subunit
VARAQFPVAVVENRELGSGYFALTMASLRANSVADASAGQFVMLRGEWGRDLISGRAFSVLRVDDERTFTVLGKVFGRGTALMAAMRAGDPVTVTGPLGTPFRAPLGTRQLLVAGGVGLPPLHMHALALARAGRASEVTMVYGGRSAGDLVLVDELEDAGIDTVLVTEDGSRGHKGRVTAPLEQALDRAGARAHEVLACGPTAMLRAVRSIALARDIDTQLCLEEQMACGFGVCLGCAVPVYGARPYKYCCTDGPVFAGRELRWS